MATDSDNGVAESDMMAMLLYTLLAATFDAVSDTISDEVVGVVGEECYASPLTRSSGARKIRSPSLGAQSAAWTIASVPGTPRYGSTPPAKVWLVECDVA